MAIPLAQPRFDPRYVRPFLLSEPEVDARISAPGRTLLREYAKIPDKEIAAHVADIVGTHPNQLPFEDITTS